MKARPQLVPLICISPGATIMVGQIVAFDEHGRVLVQADGLTTTVAQVTEAAQRSLSDAKEVVGRTVLITRQEHPSELPVILDVLHDRLERRPLRVDEVQRISAKRVGPAAGVAVELGAGRSAIVLYVLGRLVVRGVKLLARARSPKRIHADSLEMN